MKILVLNGSPRPGGDTAAMIRSFREEAERLGHQVVEFPVCRMNIRGCLACEYCHGKGQGSCVQQDDMQQIYAELRDTEMLVLAAPIYYHGISGQLKCAIDRWIRTCTWGRSFPMTGIFWVIWAWRTAASIPITTRM